ncbi:MULTISPECIES: hypothetical protein [Calothrix]|uniref:Uncharacterized protein n=2 Tax=Calothrix TaxID=1186 RepID=A0ABR8A4B5_9CYAN|nr:MULTISPECIES: hypothetical protein [Calothrix]MBD2194796.1 hypothetical protein [Calothrix parietina FACHB-288]MBD2228796.1 hypothetical protein [Calothrix anomala FACHB-343]
MFNLSVLAIGVGYLHRLLIKFITPALIKSWGYLWLWHLKDLKTLLPYEDVI